jgi:outer membrane protein OmpA-like peptidoglycan-associated protein
MIIEVSAHTDNLGSDEYNMNLSDKRAKSVVEYLISKGIAAERLQSKGYGETMPVAPNKLENGKDNPEGRAKNRRTEFKVLSN